MSKKAIVGILKWCTVLILLLSALFFFLPYRGDISALKAIELAIESSQSSLIVELVLRFIVPVGLTLLAALLMLFRFSVARSVISTILCAIAVFFYGLYIGDYMKDFVGVSIGLSLNFIISILGIILPIANIVVVKAIKEKTSTFS